MWKGEKGEEIFTMKMEKGFKKPLARQIREGVEIEMSNETLMNSKSEWNSAQIPRIVIEEGERQTEDIESALGKKGEQEKSERRKECLVELNKSIKRGGGELDREGERILEVKKRRVETVRQIPDSTGPQKRQSKESERDKAEVRKTKMSRVTKERESVGIRGEGRGEGILFWAKKFKDMAKESNKSREDVKGAKEHIDRIEKLKKPQRVMKVERTKVDVNGLSITSEPIGQKSRLTEGQEPLEVNGLTVTSGTEKVETVDETKLTMKKTVKTVSDRKFGTVENVAVTVVEETVDTVNDRVKEAKTVIEMEETVETRIKGAAEIIFDREVTVSEIDKVKGVAVETVKTAKLKTN